MRDQAHERAVKLIAKLIYDRGEEILDEDDVDMDVCTEIAESIMETLEAYKILW